MKPKSKPTPTPTAPSLPVLDGPDIAALRAWRAASPGARVTVFHSDGSVSLIQLSFRGRQARTFPKAKDAATAVALPGGVFADVPSAEGARAGLARFERSAAKRLRGPINPLVL